MAYSFRLINLLCSMCFFASASLLRLILPHFKLGPGTKKVNPPDLSLFESPDLVGAEAQAFADFKGDVADQLDGNCRVFLL